MAIDASEILYAHRKDHRLSEPQCRALHGSAREVRTAAESKSLDRNHVPSIIISASGMATGGRILHHLKVFAPDPRNTVLFAGFQAGGTRGAAMVGGADQIKIHGEYIPVRADVMNLDMLSAHADADEIMGWLRAVRRPPRTVFVTHGEPAASDALRRRIQEELGWTCRVPAYRDQVELT
jgi:metallo-beta-lactamase family protein